MQHPALAEAGRVARVLRRGRGAEVPRRAAHPRIRRLRALARQARARGGLRHRHGLDQLRACGRRAHGRRSLVGVASGCRAARRGHGGRRPDPLPRRRTPRSSPQRSTERRSTSSTRSASSTTRRARPCARRDAEARRARRDAQADGLPPSLVEGLLDPRHAGARPVLAGGGAHREARRGADRLPGRVHVHASRGPRARRARGIPASSDLERRPRVPVPHPRLRRVPVREGAVLPVDARPAVPRASSGPSAGTS